MNLYTKQKQTHRHENKLTLPKGREGGKIRNIGLTDTHYYT